MEIPETPDPAPRNTLARLNESHRHSVSEPTEGEPEYDIMSASSSAKGKAPAGSIDVARENAKKQVRFEFEDLDRLTKPGKVPTKLRRRSEELKRTHLPVETHEDTETLRADDNLPTLGDEFHQDEVDQDGNMVFTSTLNFRNDTIRIRGDPSDFEEAVGSQLGQFLCGLSHNDIDEDLKERMHDIAARCAKADGAAMPFTPMTLEGKTVFSDEGLMTLDSFVTKCSQHPEALYREMKLRAIMLAARHQQAEDFHVMTHQLDTCVVRALAWAYHFSARLKVAVQDEAAHKDAAPAADDAVIEQLTQVVDIRDNEIADLKNRIEQLEQLNRDLRQRATTPASSIVTAGGTHKSAKHPDPVLFEGKRTDNFEYWLRSIRNKLKANADHYPNDESRRMYIESRIGGDAADNLEPYLDPDHPDSITTSDQLLDHLTTEYRNPNQYEDAYDKFAALKLDPTADFHAFKNQFVRYAGQLRKPKSEWKLEFKRRLTISLRTACASEYLDPNVTFEQYARKAAEIANEFRQAREAKKHDDKARTGGTPTTGSTVGNRGRGGNTSGRVGDGNRGTSDRPPPTARASGRPPAAEVKKLYEEGRCFNCRETGHVVKDCPSARKTAVSAVEDKPTFEDQHHRINTLLNAQFGTVADKETPSSEN